MRSSAIGLLLLAMLGSLPIWAEGLIEFKSTSVNFGEIKEGETADVVYEFTNVGDSLLKITNVVATCGCTVSQLNKREYSPGEKGAIPIRFYSRGYQGRVVKSLVVHSDDKKNPQVRLQLTGVVNVTDFADIAFSKSELNFGDVVLGKNKRLVLTLSNPGNLDLRIAQVSHTPDVYLIFPKSILAPKEKIDLEIVFSATRPGTFSNYIRFTTNALGKGQEMVRFDAAVIEK